MSSSVRTRFAPSPTGPLHMGGVRTALFCYLFTKKNNGSFILRIEDTDQKRFVSKAEDYIIESLKWCGIVPDEGVGSEDKGYGPYRQSERKNLYGKYIIDLVNSGNAYYAFDTSEDLDKMREDLKKQGNPSPQYNNITRQYMKNSLTLPEDEVKSRLENNDPYVIRFKMPRNEEVKFEDVVRGWVNFNSNQLDDKILMKSDGMPTYHLANVVDDHLMEITHVIRGEEWLSSTPLHVMLYKAFDWDMPVFAHLPLILKPDGKGKLSKRDGDRLGFPVFPLNWTDPDSGEESTGYRERGFFPEAFTNMLAFLGWNPGTDQEIFSLEELIEAFTLERVGKAGAKFDFEKTKWFNEQWLKRMDPEKIVSLIKPDLESNNHTESGIDLVRFVDLMKERATFIHDIPKTGYYVFEEIKEFDEKMISKKIKPELIEKYSALLQLLTEMKSFDSEELEKSIKQFMEENSLGFGQVLPFLRLAITGTMQGPSIFQIMDLIGKDKCLKRINFFLENKV